MPGAGDEPDEAVDPNDHSTSMMTRHIAQPFTALEQVSEMMPSHPAEALETQNLMASWNPHSLS
jgi:hypothetical protein